MYSTQIEYETHFNKIWWSKGNNCSNFYFGGENFSLEKIILILKKIYIIFSVNSNNVRKLQWISKEEMKNNMVLIFLSVKSKHNRSRKTCSLQISSILSHKSS